MQEHPVLHALVRQGQTIKLVWSLPSQQLVVAARVAEGPTHGARGLLLGTLDPPLATFVASRSSPQLASPTASDHRASSYCT